MAGDSRVAERLDAAASATTGGTLREPDLAAGSARFLTYHEYAAGPGLVSRTIQDVDNAQLSVPAGWSTPVGGGLHLVTDYQYDAQGRVRQVLGPEHDIDDVPVRTASWTVYQDADHETWSAQGYAVESASSSSSSGGGPTYDYTLVNPVSIQKHSAAHATNRSRPPARPPAAGSRRATCSIKLPTCGGASVSSMPLANRRPRVGITRFPVRATAGSRTTTTRLATVMIPSVGRTGSRSRRHHHPHGVRPA